MELWERECVDCNVVMEQKDIDRKPRNGYPLFPECCTVCANRRMSAWKRQRNQQAFQQLKQDPDIHERHRKRLQGNSHKRKFGISLTEYETLLEAQHGLCAVCGQPEKFIDVRSGLPKSLAVDHDHKTGRVRTLLCSACNYSFGLLGENPERIKLLLDYAEKVKLVASRG